MAVAMEKRGAWPADSPWIRDAFAARPRHEFAPDRLWHWDGYAYLPIDRKSEPQRWLSEVYASVDAPSMTEIDGGVPSSSLSCPAIISDMLDSPCWSLASASLNSVPARGSTPRDDGTVDGYLHDGRSSWATLTQAGSGVADAAQQGPRRLAEEAMRALHLWAQHAEPSVYDFGMTVRPDRQWIWCGSPDSDPYAPCDH